MSIAETVVPNQVNAKLSPETPYNTSASVPIPDASKTPSITRPIRQGHGPEQSHAEPRRFHLTKTSFKVPSAFSVSKTSRQGRSKASRNELAVFVESRKASIEQSARRKEITAKTVTVRPSNNGTATIDLGDTLRKRPLATDAERKWRAKNWAKPSEPSASAGQRAGLEHHTRKLDHNWDVESPELAAQLQQLVHEEMRLQENSGQSESGFRNLKVKPKPPKPRKDVVERTKNREVDEDDVMRDIDHSSENAEYVFDTYVRSLSEPPETPSSDGILIDPLHGMDVSKLGILVVEDAEEEDMWEKFGEYIDSDPDWNSEEEDENGRQAATSLRDRTDCARS